MIKRVLIKNFYQSGFPKTTVQAAKRIGFGMREHYLVPSDCKFVFRPILVRTKYCNYVPSVGVIFCAAWWTVLDDSVLSYCFPSAPFPVWYNHRNLTNFLSYKSKNFEQHLPNREYKDYIFQKFYRPKPRKQRNTL